MATQTQTQQKWSEVKASLVAAFGTLPPNLERAFQVCFYGGASFGALELRRLADSGDEGGIRRFAAELEQGMKAGAK